MTVDISNVIVEYLRPAFCFQLFRQSSQYISHCWSFCLEQNTKAILRSYSPQTGCNVIPQFEHRQCAIHNNHCDILSYRAWCQNSTNIDHYVALGVTFFSHYGSAYARETVTIVTHPSILTTTTSTGIYHSSGALRTNEVPSRKLHYATFEHTRCGCTCSLVAKQIGLTPLQTIAHRAVIPIAISI